MRVACTKSDPLFLEINNPNSLFLVGSLAGPLKNGDLNPVIF